MPVLQSNRLNTHIVEDDAILLYPRRHTPEWRFVMSFAHGLLDAAKEKANALFHLRNLVDQINTLDMFPGLRDRLKAAATRFLTFQEAGEHI